MTGIEWWNVLKNTYARRDNNSAVKRSRQQKAVVVSVVHSRRIVIDSLVEVQRHARGVVGFRTNKVAGERLFDLESGGLGGRRARTISKVCVCVFVFRLSGGVAVFSESHQRDRSGSSSASSIGRSEERGGGGVALGWDLLSSSSLHRTVPISVGFVAAKLGFPKLV